MRRDLHNDLKVTNAIPPAAAVTGDTPFVSTILDTWEFLTNEFVWLAGSIADSNVTFTLLVEESDDSGMSGATAVPDAQLLGTEAAAAPLFGSDNKAGKIGYRGSKRYIRVTITPSGNSGDIYLAAAWLQAFARSAAQTTQIV